MKTTLHIFKKDFKHFGPVLIGIYVLAGLTAVLSGFPIPSQVFIGIHTLLSVVTIAGLIFVTARIIQIDSPAHTCAQWLTRPIGRPGHLLGEDAAARLGNALSPHIWSWITRQVPEIASRVRVAERVEEKIRDYPLAQLEKLVRSVTEQELKLIVRLGYVLGGVIGTIRAPDGWCHHPPRQSLVSATPTIMPKAAAPRPMIKTTARVRPLFFQRSLQIL